MDIINPTFRGLVRTKADLLVVVEACLRGFLSHTPRKPSLEELSSLVQMGNTFVYERNASGFQEWIDNIPWTLVERGDAVDKFMCIPFNLYKMTARIDWQCSAHFIVSYQPMPHYQMTALQCLRDCTNVRNLTPRDGLSFERHTGWAG